MALFLQHYWNTQSKQSPPAPLSVTLRLVLIDAQHISFWHCLTTIYMQPQEYRVPMTGWSRFVMKFHNLGILIGQTTKQGKTVSKLLRSNFNIDPLLRNWANWCCVWLQSYPSVQCPKNAFLPWSKCDNNTVSISSGSVDIGYRLSICQLEI